MPRIRRRLATCAAAVAALALPTAANAEMIQVPAAAFTGDSARSALSAGVLRGADEAFDAPLPLQGAGLVCSLTMVYEDAAPAPSLTVSLLRKNVVYGGSAEFSPNVLASVSSAPGTYNWVNRATTTVIDDPRVNAAKDFYYLRAEFKGDGGPDVGLLGVMIDIRKDC